MLTKEDLKQIGGLMDEKFVGFEQKIDKKMDEKFAKFEDRIVGRIVADVGEMIEENVLPQFDRLENTLVTKNYLDDKLGDLRGEFALK